MTFYCDFETFPFSAGLPVPPPVSFQLYDPENSQVMLMHIATGEVVTFPVVAGGRADYTKPTYHEGADLETSLRYLAKTALTEGRRVVWHNASFDMAVWSRFDVENPDRLLQAKLVSCTMLREKLLRLERGESKFIDDNGKRTRTSYSMEACVSRYFGADLSGDKGGDSWRLKYHTLVDVPLREWPLDAVMYACDDVLWTYLIDEAQAARPCGNYQDESNQVDADYELQLVTAWGLRSEQRALDIVSEQVDKHYEEYMSELDALGVLRKNGSKDMKMYRSHIIEAYDYTPPLTKTGQKHLQEGLQMPPKALVDMQIKAYRESPKQYKKRWPQVLKEWGLSQGATLEEAEALEGEVSETFVDLLSYCATDSETLAEGDSEVLFKLSELSVFKTIKESFIPKISVGVDRPICPSYDVLKETGRTSSFGDLNVQNQPRFKGLRECFVPRKGYVYVAIDYDSLELRAVAQACLFLVGYSTLAERYIQDPEFDPHLYMACNILGISYEEGQERKAAGDKEIKRVRQLSKIANFGFWGGMAARSFISYAKGYGVYISLAEAEELREAWQRTWPEQEDYFTYIRSLLSPTDNRGAGTLPVSGRTRTGASYCALANYFFQGPAADGMKKAMRLVGRECRLKSLGSPLYGSHIVAMIHDELLLEVPIATYKEAMDRLQELLVQGMAEDIPDVPVCATAHAMDRWFKDPQPETPYEIYTEEETYGNRLSSYAA